MSDENRPVVWSRPGCPQCVQTKKAFMRLGVEPDERMVDEVAVADLRRRGFMSLPVVEWKGQEWAGFQPDLIRAVA